MKQGYECGQPAATAELEAPESFVIKKSLTESEMIPEISDSVAGRAVERKPKQFWMAGAKSFRWWNRSLKFRFRFHSPSLWGKLVVQIIQWFSTFNGPNHFGAGAKNFRCQKPELEIWVPAPERWCEAGQSSRTIFQGTVLLNVACCFQYSFSKIFLFVVCVKMLIDQESGCYLAVAFV